MKKLLSIILVLAMALSLCVTTAWADGDVDKDWYSDSGVSFTISDKADLLGLAALVNEGKDFSGKTVTLSGDIDLAGVAWTAIGDGTRSGSSYDGKAFKGTFDGGGHTISGVSGMLFGVLDGGTIKNLKVDANIDASTTTSDAAAVVGIVVNGGTVSGVTVSGSVKGAKSVGGVVGRMLIEGSVINCTNNATITSTGDDKAGGIIGAAYYTAAGKTMTISGCSNTGAVTSNGNQGIAGGIVGLSAADVKNCYNTAAITAGNEAGGIIGEQVNRGTVSSNTNSGKVSNESTSKGSSYGGIVGWVRYKFDGYPEEANSLVTISGNTNSGVISASGINLGAGGIVGTVYNQASVTGNTNTAASIAGGKFAAGIVGGAQMSIKGVPEDNPGNVVLEGQTITVSNNVSTTSIDNISVSSGECKTEYVWLNDTAFVAKNNTNVITYTVTFDSNGGSAVEAQSVAAGSTAAKPADPTREGYTFVGWVDDAGAAYDFSKAVNGDLTLTAVWEETISHTPINRQNTTTTTTTDTTVTDTTKADTVTSAKTFDAGIMAYGVMAVASVLGMGYVGKKRG